VLAALGSTLSNKYAEGYPGRRYYGGCAEVDRAEEIGIARAKALFGADARQPAAALGRERQPGRVRRAAAAGRHRAGDVAAARRAPHPRLEGQLLAARGSDRALHVRADTELIDYDEVRDLALEHRPKMIIAGATAYPRLIDFARFREIADEVGAWLMVDARTSSGSVAGGPSRHRCRTPTWSRSRRHKVLRGPRGGMIVCRSELAQRIDKAVFPLPAGRSRDARGRRAKAVGAGECLQPAYRAYRRTRSVANAQALTEVSPPKGMRPVSPDGHRRPPSRLLDLQRLGAHRRRRPETTLRRRRGITLNKNAIPYDPQKPMVASGNPRRHARGHHAGHDRADDEGGRDADRPAPSRTPTAARRRGRRGGGSARGQHPAYPPA
jgi:glycine hydroxymethyltransferase